MVVSYCIAQTLFSSDFPIRYILSLLCSATILLYNSVLLRYGACALGACLKVHKMENFFDSDFGICVISLLVMSKY